MQQITHQQLLGILKGAIPNEGEALGLYNMICYEDEVPVWLSEEGEIRIGRRQGCLLSLSSALDIRPYHLRIVLESALVISPRTMEIYLWDVFFKKRFEIAKELLRDRRCPVSGPILQSALENNAEILWDDIVRHPKWQSENFNIQITLAKWIQLVKCQQGNLTWLLDNLPLIQPKTHLDLTIPIMEGVCYYQAFSVMEKCIKLYPEVATQRWLHAFLNGKHPAAMIPSKVIDVLLRVKDVREWFYFLKSSRCLLEHRLAAISEVRKIRLEHNLPLEVARLVKEFLIG